MLIILIKFSKITRLNRILEKMRFLEIQQAPNSFKLLVIFCGSLRTSQVLTQSVVNTLMGAILKWEKKFLVQRLWWKWHRESRYLDALKNNVACIYSMVFRLFSSLLIRFNYVNKTKQQATTCSLPQVRKTFSCNWFLCTRSLKTAVNLWSKLHFCALNVTQESLFIIGVHVPFWNISFWSVKFSTDHKVSSWQVLFVQMEINNDAVFYRFY